MKACQKLQVDEEQQDCDENEHVDAATADYDSQYHDTALLAMMWMFPTRGRHRGDARGGLQAVPALQPSRREKKERE